GDGIAQGVPHGDPALHGGHGGQRQHTGAVPGGVDAAHRGARDAVDVDVPAFGDGHSGFGQAQVLGVRHSPDRHQAVRAVHDAPVGEFHLHAVAPAAHRFGAGAGQDVHATAFEHSFDHIGGVRVLPGQHAVPAG